MELHIVFNYSAAGSIRQFLAGHEADVARFSDNLSYGPIDLSNEPTEKSRSTVRRAWVGEHLGHDNPGIVSDGELFWPRVLSKDVSRVAWVSQRNAAEFCGFLEFVWRLGDLPTQIIDTTLRKGADGEFFRGTASIPVSDMRSLDLLGAAHDLDPHRRAHYRAIWSKLQTEDSDLRVVGGDLNLSSVPWTFYDQMILSLVGTDWQPMVRVAGNFLATEAADDLFVFSRLYTLVDAGVLAARESGRSHPDVRLITQ
jgi:hypothetical protein